MSSASTDRPGSPVIELPQASVLVRTWFGDDGAWRSLLAEVETPSEDGFLACARAVDDRAFEGLTADGLRTAQTSGAFVSFLADETTLTSDDHPILAVWVHEGDHESFRVVPSELWSVENNINLCNMDWDEFTRACDADGVFRGF